MQSNLGRIHQKIRESNINIIQSLMAHLRTKIGIIENNARFSASLFIFLVEKYSPRYPSTKIESKLRMLVNRFDIIFVSKLTNVIPE